jgi:hypothetical protein
MVDIEYANAYSEVLEILKYISVDDYNKIPKEKIELFETNANNDYIFNYNPDKTLNEQNVSKIAKGIIAILFRDYWATEIQRKKIIAKQNYDRMKLEEEKIAKYNPNEIFKKKQNNTISSLTESSEENLDLIAYKESKWYKKIFEKILKVFRKN